jgi:cytoskeletal protein RodZ
MNPNSLRERREALGLSLDDVYRRTRINPELLTALEAGDYKVLPDTYVRLFLKKYCQELGLPPAEAIAEYERQCPPPPAPEDAPPGSASAKARRAPPGAILAASLVVAGLVGAIWWFGRTGPVPPDPRARVRPAVGRFVVDPPQKSEPVRTPAPPPARRDPESPPSVVQAHAAQSGPAGPGPAQAGTAGPPDQAQSEPAGPPAPPDTGVPPSTEEGAGLAGIPDFPPAEVVTPGPDASRGGNDSVAAAVSPPDSGLLPGPQRDPVDSAAATPDRVVAAFSLTPDAIFAPDDSVITLTVRGLDDTQASITGDGDLIYRGPIEAGRRTSWRARDRFLLEARSGAALEIALQGTPIRPLGRSGERIRLFVSRSSIWVEEIQAVPGDAAAR